MFSDLATFMNIVLFMELPICSFVPFNCKELNSPNLITDNIRLQKICTFAKNRSIFCINLFS